MEEFTFSKELIELFDKTSFKEEEAKLVDLNSGKDLEMTPDEDDYIYIPELTTLHPTSLVNNGDDENASYDYTFLVKLVNEFRRQVNKEDI